MKLHGCILVLILVQRQGFAQERCGHIYITARAKSDYNLVMNWDFNNCPNVPDTLQLLDHNKVIENVNVNTKTGQYISKIPFSLNPTLPENWNENDSNPSFTNLCFPYDIVSKKNRNILDKSCFQIYPNWMERFGDLHLGDMMIPGTHNSGAWTGQPKIIKNYILNQHRNFWQQLVFGIRYFDLRVGVYGNTVFIIHDLFKLTPLEPELDHVVNFLKKSPKEVVIIELRRFSGDQGKNFDHPQVLSLLWRKLGNHAYPRPTRYNPKGPRLSEIWQTGRRVIISYNQPDIVNETPWVWYGIYRNWGDLISVNALENYIIATTSNRNNRNPMSTIMAELTPTSFYIFRHPTRSLRYLAEKVNPFLAIWLRKDHRYRNVSIIATDFFLGNDLVRLSVQANEEKLLEYH